MRALISLALLVPSALMTGPDRVRTQMVRPTSYVLTLIRESKPGVIHDPNLHIYPPYPLYAGLSRLQVNVWWARGRWREKDRWLLAPSQHTSSLAQLTTAPLPNTSASDGHRIWMYDPHPRTITVYPSDPAGTWPATEGSLKQFTVRSTLSAVLKSEFHCVAPVRHPDQKIGGRPTYVIEFPEDQCRHLHGGRYANQSRLLDGRVVFWIDQQTHFALRLEQYAFGNPRQLILSQYVTFILYNVRLRPSLFQLRVPHGYKLVHGH